MTSTNWLRRAMRAWLRYDQRIGHSRFSVLEQVRSSRGRFHLLIALKKAYSFSSMWTNFRNFVTLFTASLISRFKAYAAQWIYQTFAALCLIRVWTPPYAPLILATPSYPWPRIFRMSVTLSISLAMTAVRFCPFLLSTEAYWSFGNLQSDGRSVIIVVKCYVAKYFAKLIRVRNIHCSVHNIRHKRRRSYFIYNLLLQTIGEKFDHFILSGPTKIFSWTFWPSQ